MRRRTAEDAADAMPAHLAHPPAVVANGETLAVWRAWWAARRAWRRAHGLPWLAAWCADVALWSTSRPAVDVPAGVVLVGDQEGPDHV